MTHHPQFDCDLIAKELQSENAALKAELTAAQKDAERYRWLTQACDDLTPLLREYHSGVCFLEELDTAIDKEMEK